MVLKKGNYIKRIGGKGRWVTPGKLYEILDVDMRGNVLYENDDGFRRWFEPLEWAWEKVTSPRVVRNTEDRRGYTLTIPKNTIVEVVKYSGGGFASLNMLVRIPDVEFERDANIGWRGTADGIKGRYYWVKSDCYKLASIVVIGGE